MTVLENYKASYDAQRSNCESKYEWAANYIFDLTTYDGDIDEYFVQTIIEVCEVILEKRNFEYIQFRTNYIKYIVVCQLLDKFGWIDWGTSIRGAWFDEIGYQNKDQRYILDLGWGNEDVVDFSLENLRILIDFIESDD